MLSYSVLFTYLNYFWQFDISSPSFLSIFPKMKSLAYNPMPLLAFTLPRLLVHPS